MVNVLFPINVIIFCVELDLSEADFNAKLNDPKELKKEVQFTLDKTKIPSVSVLKDVLMSCSVLKFYNEAELATKGIMYFGTQFAHKAAKSQAFAVLNFSDLKNSKFTVYSSKSEFLDAILKDILDIIT